MIPLERLSLLCHSMATCLSAGLSVPASLRTSVRSSAEGPLKGIVETAAERTASGTALSEALEPSRDRFPSFFLPVVRCGEQDGRLDEAFHYLANHCHLMLRPARLVRNMWLLPLAILAAFSLIGIATMAVSAPIWATLAYAVRELATYAILAAVAAAVLLTPKTKAVVDRVRMALPLVRDIEQDLAVNRFFHALNLVYCTGGSRVESMIHLAAESVDNHLIRHDLMRAGEVVASGGNLADALAGSVFIADEYKQTVRIGEESGKLEHAFETICRLTQQTLERRVQTFSKCIENAVKIAIVLSFALGAGSQFMAIRPAT